MKTTGQREALAAGSHVYIGIFDQEHDGQEVYIATCCRCGTEIVDLAEELDECTECQEAC